VLLKLQQQSFLLLRENNKLLLHFIAVLLPAYARLICLFPQLVDLASQLLVFAGFDLHLYLQSLPEYLKLVYLPVL
jgi:hypothetical protein